MFGSFDELANDMTERDCIDQLVNRSEFINKDKTRRIEFYTLPGGWVEEILIDGDLKCFEGEGIVLVYREKGEPDEVKEYGFGDLAPVAEFKNLSQSRSYTRYGSSRL